MLTIIFHLPVVLISILATMSLNAVASEQFKSRDILKLIEQEGVAISRVLNSSQLNGMMINAYELRLEMSLEKSLRHLSAVLNQPQAIYFQHDDLPINMIQWTRGQTSFLILLGQVSAGQTTGLLSTLDPRSDGSTEWSQSGARHHFKNLQETDVLIKLLGQLKHKKLFTFHDENMLAGFVDASMTHATSKMYQRIFQSHSWVPVAESNNCQNDQTNLSIKARDSSFPACRYIMKKNGNTVEINHINSGNHTLTLIYGKSSG